MTILTLLRKFAPAAPPPATNPRLPAYGGSGTAALVPEAGNASARLPAFGGSGAPAVIVLGSSGNARLPAYGGSGSGVIPTPDPAVIAARAPRYGGTGTSG